MKYLLPIASNYTGTAYALRGCENDAADWQAALTPRGFTLPLGALLGPQATRANILSGLAELCGMAKRGDTIVVPKSLHGTKVPDQDGDEPDHWDEALCPDDMQSAGIITDDELHTTLQKRAWGVRVVLIADLCHSGTLARFADLGPRPTLTHRDHVRDSGYRRPRFLPPDVFLRGAQVERAVRAEQLAVPLTSARPQALVVSGCRDDQVSYDAVINGRARGAFSYAALLALNTITPDASYKSWHQRIRTILPNAQYDQEPQLSGSPFQRYGKALG